MEDAFSLCEPRLVPCGEGYSFFHDLVERRWPKNGPLHRLCSLARKMGVQSYVSETLAPNDEIRQEIEAVAKHPDYAGSPVTGRAIRLSFFRSCPKAWQDVTSEDFLGYAVMLELLQDGKRLRHNGRRMAFVLESVVRPPTIFLDASDGRTSAESASNYYVHCTRPFKSVVGIASHSVSLQIDGSFFCQQNGLTHVCVHAALRTAINSSPSIRGPRVPEKLTNLKINEILGVDYADKASVGRLRGGLNAKEIEKVVNDMGLYPKSYEFPNHHHIGYAEYVYPLIESRFPVILGVYGQMGGHAIAVLGHTVNSDRWEPQARDGYGAFPLVRYHSSSLWADHFIIADDNVGMHVTLPREMIRNFLVPEFDPNLHASMAVGLVPRTVRVNGYDAEALASRIAEQFLKSTVSRPGCRWLRFLRGTIDRRGDHHHPTLVCRTVLTTRDCYCQEMAHAKDSEPPHNALTAGEVELLKRVLPRTIWVTEISLPDLYTANKHKIGDLIIDAGATRDKHQNCDSLVFAWLPGIARCGPGLATVVPDWSLKGHVRLLRHGDRTIPRLEW